MAVIHPPIDPRYQYMLTQCPAPELAPPKRGYIPITAKVSNVLEWRHRAEHGGAFLGSEIPCGQNWIVTAQIPFFQFIPLNNLPYIRSLRVATPIFLDLNDTVREIGLVASSKLPGSVLDQGGKDVVVGIVDSGCDFNHSHFKSSSNKTRIHSIWVQRDELAQRNGKVIIVRKDQQFSESQINNALRTPDPYATLQYDLLDRNNEVLDHGTHVMDIAAGSGPNPGVAPKAKIIFVDLEFKIEITKNIAGDVRRVKLTNSNRLIDAVKYIFDKAKELKLPCVVNLSLGQHGGPHDGTTHVEEAFDNLLKEPNRAIVLAAGNSYEERSHCSGVVTQGNIVDINWEIQKINPDPDYIRENELEIWYSAHDEFEIEIFRDKLSLGRFPLGKDSPITHQSQVIGYASHRKADGAFRDDPKNQDHVFQIFHNANVDPERSVWTFQVYGKRIQKGHFHAWIERGSTSHFFRADPSYTLSSIGTGQKTIVVGSYNAHMPDTPISYFSSAGPTRDGRPKPEVSAPGHYVLAACAKTQNGVTEMPGTSMAAPAVTGLVARILGQAYEKKINLPIDDIRKALILTCRKNPPSPDQDWDPRYGFGRVYAGSILAFTSGQPSGASVAKKSIAPPQTPPPAKPIAQDACSSSRCGTRPCTCPIKDPFMATVVKLYHPQLSKP